MSFCFHYALQFAQTCWCWFFFSLAFVLLPWIMYDIGNMAYIPWLFGSLDLFWFNFVIFLCVYYTIFSLFQVSPIVALLFGFFIFSTYYYGFLILCVVRVVAAAAHVVVSLLPNLMPSAILELCFDFNQTDFLHCLHRKHLCHFIRFGVWKVEEQIQTIIKTQHQQTSSTIAKEWMHLLLVECQGIRFSLIVVCWFQTILAAVLF